MNKIAIIGGGAWGLTLAEVLADNKIESLIYEISNDKVELINHSINPIFNDIKINQLIKATNKLEDVINYSDIFLLAIPSKFVRNFLKEFKKINNKKVNIISAIKSLEPETGYRISEICKSELENNLKNFASLAGPSHAEDVILKKITLLTVASENEEFAKNVQNFFSNNKYLRVYWTNDLIGTEIGSSCKNAIAVVSGVIEGLSLGENARAALITRSLKEIIKIIKFLNGKPETAYGLSGLGDLIVTATSLKSRNFKAGLLLAKGKTVSEIEENEKQTIEGFRVIDALSTFAKKNKIELPIIQTAKKVLLGKIKPLIAINELLNRNLKNEE